MYNIFYKTDVSLNNSTKKKRAKIAKNDAFEKNRKDFKKNAKNS